MCTLALVARRLELNNVIVLEQEEEIELVVEIGRKIGVRPVIGMRAKARTKHAGHFGSTSARRASLGSRRRGYCASRSGLRRKECLVAFEHAFPHWLPNSLHCILGRNGVGEAPNFCEWSSLGAGMRVIDVGAVSRRL
ncbi:hypothetical protein Scep_023483 [Stephania cephalantha]|uniref:Arginine decarboxylase n=1 Tax=Stephania cephalantha TaxID=152367 RepID=A0AAP0F089_9MAGN